MRNAAYLLILATSLLGFTISSIADDGEVRFTKIGEKRGTVTLKGCGIKRGVRSIKIKNHGKSVVLPSERDRKPVQLPGNFKFFACENIPGPGTILHMKKRADGQGVAVELKLSDFKVKKNKPSASGFGCSDLRPWPARVIYKTVGSSHFTDIRRNTIGVIAEPGSGIYAGSCLTMLASNGSTLANLGLYGRGAGWDWRAYAGIGCGSSTPVNGSGLAARAKAASGSTKVALKIGDVCYGPIEATQCVGSSSC